MSLCFDSYSYRDHFKLRGGEGKCLHLFRLDMGKTNTSSTDLTAGAESLHPRRTGRKEVEVMRMKCKGGEKYKNKDR